VAFLGTIGNVVTLGVVQSDGEVTKVTGDAEYVIAFAWMPDARSFLVAYDDTDRPDTFPPNRLAIWTLTGARVRTVKLRADLRAEDGMSVQPDGGTAVIAGTPPPAAVGFGAQSDLFLIDLYRRRQSAHSDPGSG